MVAETDVRIYVLKIYTLVPSESLNDNFLKLECSTSTE